MRANVRNWNAVWTLARRTMVGKTGHAADDGGRTSGEGLQEAFRLFLVGSSIALFGVLCLCLGVQSRDLCLRSLC